VKTKVQSPRQAASTGKVDAVGADLLCVGPSDAETRLEARGGIGQAVPVAGKTKLEAREEDGPPGSAGKAKGSAMVEAESGAEAAEPQKRKRQAQPEDSVEATPAKQDGMGLAREERSAAGIREEAQAVPTTKMSERSESAMPLTQDTASAMTGLQNNASGKPTALPATRVPERPDSTRATAQSDMVPAGKVAERAESVTPTAQAAVGPTTMSEVETTCGNSNLDQKASWRKKNPAQPTPPPAPPPGSDDEVQMAARSRAGDAPSATALPIMEDAGGNGVCRDAGSTAALIANAMPKRRARNNRQPACAKGHIRVGAAQAKLHAEEEKPRAKKGKRRVKVKRRRRRVEGESAADSRASAQNGGQAGVDAGDDVGDDVGVKDGEDAGVSGDRDTNVGDVTSEVTPIVGKRTRHRHSSKEENIGRSVEVNGGHSRLFDDRRHQIGTVEASANAEVPAHVDAEDDTFGDIDESLSEKEQCHLQRDIGTELMRLPELADKGQDTKDTLSEIVVCMVLTGKKPSEVSDELEGFLGESTPAFVAWLISHLRGPWLRARRARAGATPKSAAAPRGRSGRSRGCVAAG